MIVIIVFMYIVIASIYLLRVVRGQWLLNPASLFVLAQLIFFLGTIPLLDMDLQADVVYLLVMFSGLCFFVLGVLFAHVIFPVSSRDVKNWFSAPFYLIESGFSFNLLIWIIIATSIVVNVIYYYLIGYNFFIEVAMSKVMGYGLDDVTALRLQTYAGDRYFAPGYVNQFKNVLLPLLLAYLAARYMLLHRGIDRIIVVICAPLCLVFLLGTGQRAPLFLGSLMILVFFRASLPARLWRRASITVMSLALILFLVSTLFLGRSATEIRSPSDMGAILGNLLQRIFSDNQLGGIVGFRYVYELPIQWGGEWMKGLAGLLPGQTAEISIPNEVHAILYNSYRGTAPESIWASVWHNFHVVGVVVLPFLLGLLYQGLFARLVHSPKTLFRLLVYAGLSIIFGLWVAGGPAFLAEVGLFTIIILKILVDFWLRLNRRIIGSIGQTGMTLVPRTGRPKVVKRVA
jgi:hypothetical protein